MLAIVDCRAFPELPEGIRYSVKIQMELKTITMTEG
jgi:hypothetical protein